MKATTSNPFSKLGKLTLLVGLLLLLAPALRHDEAGAANPCARYPPACHYTWDPASGCCLADPRFDCYDVC
jgi:hypothetical protein